MIRLVLAVLIACVAANRPARSDEPVARALDLDFGSVVETWAAHAVCAAVPGPYRVLIDGLDADRYLDRERAAGKLAALCSADPAAHRWLLRARAVERRPEVRYWLNRLLRQLERCEACDGAGYCPEFRPSATEQPAYGGALCRRCGRSEWQHGLQWIEGCRYSYLACGACGGSGTYWNHYAVD
jgi:hypothetical protein